MIDLMQTLEISLKGGLGSGNYGHVGRPGKIGGSAPAKGIGPESNAGYSPLEIGENVGKNSRLLSGDETGYWNQHNETIKRMRAAGKTVTASRPISWASPSGGTYEDVAGMQKMDNIQRVVDKSGAEWGVVHGILRQWAKGSQTEWSLQFQQAVAEEFGVPVPKYIDRKVNKIPGETYWSPEHRFDKEVAKKVARAMYDTTQETLRNMGIGPNDYINLYRGCNRSTLVNVENRIPDKPGVYRYTGNPIESWSLNYRTAAKFGRKRVQMAVKAKNIFSCSLSGIGCLSETEFIVFGSVEGYHASIR